MLNKWFNKRSRKTLFPAFAITVAVAFIAPWAVFADNLNANDVSTNTNSATITVGGTTTVDYWLVATNNDATGCDANTTSPVNVSLSVPTGISADKTSFQLTNCGTSNFVAVTFTGGSASATAYSITATASGGISGSSFNNTPATVSITVNSATPSNHAPTVSADNPSVVVDEGTQATNTGTWADQDAGDTVLLSASVGNVTENNDGTWSWGYTPDDGPADNQTVTITATDSHNATSTATFDLTVNNVPPTISGISGATSVLTGVAHSYNGSATDPSSADTNAGFTWNWLVNGTTPTGSPGNPITLNFSSCGSYSVSATATDKDNGVSDPASLTVNASAAAWQPPLTYGATNVAKGGSVIPTKITVGCNGTPVTGLSPKIALLSGDVDGTTDTGTDTLATLSASAADTTGVMRYDSTAGQYIYNLQVPATSSKLYTIRVRPFGDTDTTDALYILIKTK